MTDKPTVDGHLQIKFNPFTFPDNTTPNGCLSRDPRAQACWYFYTLAQKQKENVGESTEDQFGLLDDMMWMDRHYVQTARTVAMMYGLESPDEFAKAWDDVRDEARRLGLPEPHPSYTKLTPRFVLQ